MKKDLMTPIAIVVAGAIIALALYFALSGKANAPTAQNGGEQAPQEINIRGIQKDDLLKGDKNAKLVIYEYSDTECPFCKRFHETMNKIVDEYDGQVAWVYRHFPLDQLHPKARKEAEAVECAVKIAGPEKGFAYLDRLMELTPSNNGLDLKELPKIAQYVGVNVDSFNKCLESNETAKNVDEDAKDAMASGARGTPHNIFVIGKDKFAVPGGLPYDKMKQIVDELLKQQ